jgi:hypothetical protein
MNITRKLDNDAPGMDGGQIDLNALAAPENASPEVISTFEPKDESQPQFEKGPTELDKQIDAELGNVNKPQSSQGSDSFTQSSNNSNDQFYIQPFKELQKRLGLSNEEFQLPQDINQENYFDKLTEAIYANTEFEGQQESNLHPDVARLNELVSSGVPFEQAIQQFNDIDNLSNLNDYDLVKLSYMHKFGADENNPNGWSDEKIEATLAKMEATGMLEVKAEEVRAELEAEKQTAFEQMSYEQQLQQQQEQVYLEQVRQKGIKESLEFLNKQNDIYGLPISKSEISEFSNDFAYLVTPNPETGNAPIVDWLQSNENLAKVAYIMTRGDSKVRQAIAQAKAGAKQSIIDKLDNNPEVPRRTQGQDTTNNVDLDLLSMPARY